MSNVRYTSGDIIAVNWEDETGNTTQKTFEVVNVLTAGVKGQNVIGYECKEYPEIFGVSNLACIVPDSILGYFDPELDESNVEGLKGIGITMGTASL